MVEGEDKELKDSSLIKQPECKMGDGEDKELKEDDISQDSDCFSGHKSWHYVRLRKTCQRNEQVALLLKVLKCDKSAIPSIYEFDEDYRFYAYLTSDEAVNLSEVEEEVEDIDFLPRLEALRRAKRTRSRTNNGPLKPKKQKTQKTSLGSILSQRRQNKEKWRYNEDFEPEPESDIKDLEEEDLSEDDSLDDYDSYRYECYDEFDASGKRWYEVSLVHEKNRDYHKAFLVDVLKWDSCKSIYGYKANHLFVARMSEEEADKVAVPNLMKQPECKMGEAKDKELEDSSLMKQPECNKGEGEDKELKEDGSLHDYDDSCRYEGYYGFDASGKRPSRLKWYEVSLVDERNREYHKALLVDVLKWDSCKNSYRDKANHPFEARMSEEEADKVAEVEYVEPRRYIKIVDVN